MNPITNFKGSDGLDLGIKLITKDYLLSVYSSIAGNLLDATPELWTWGSNGSGRLGTNDTSRRTTPVTTLAGGLNWKQVSAGGIQTAAIKTDGSLWIWGNNDYGQLGINDTFSRTTPVTTISGGVNWRHVVCGYYHLTAIKTDGTLWTWGRNDFGQLGVNDSLNRTTPVTTFIGGTTWKQVSAGSYHISAIKTDGTLWTWGRNTSAHLGINDTINRSTPVTTFAGGTDWKQVSCGGFYNAAIKSDGTLWSWGSNSSGQLGVNDALRRSTPSTTFVGGTDWTVVSCGYSHTLSIKSNGTLWTWGYNLDGQLGINNAISQSTPVTTFAGGTNWKQVSGGDYHTAAIKTDGTLWVCGSNTNVQIGDNTSVKRSTPVTTFAGGNNWKQVSCGDNHTTAIESVDYL